MIFTFLSQLHRGIHAEQIFDAYDQLSDLIPLAEQNSCVCGRDHTPHPCGRVPMKSCALKWHCVVTVCQVCEVEIQSVIVRT